MLDFVNSLFCCIFGCVLIVVLFVFAMIASAMPFFVAMLLLQRCTNG